VSACNEQSHDASHCASTSDTATTVLKTENASGIISSVLSIRLGSYMQTLNPECARGYTQARASSGIPEESSAASDQNRSPVRHFAFGPRADPLLLSENPRLPEGCRSKMQLLHPPSERGGVGGKEAGDNRCATRKIAIAISPCPHPRKRKLQIARVQPPSRGNRYLACRGTLLTLISDEGEGSLMSQNGGPRDAGTEERLAHFLLDGSNEAREVRETREPRLLTETMTTIMGSPRLETMDA